MGWRDLSAVTPKPHPSSWPEIPWGPLVLLPAGALGGPREVTCAPRALHTGGFEGGTSRRGSVSFNCAGPSSGINWFGIN